MESLTAILTSPNAALVLGAALAAVVLIMFFSSKGLLKANIHGIKLGKTESETRAMLLKSKVWLELFIASEIQSLIARMKEVGFEMRPLQTMFVFEKVLDEIMSWLMVNHLDDSKEYIEQKKDVIRNVVGANVGQVNSELRNCEGYMKPLFEYCDEFTEKVIRKLDEIKRSEGF